MKKHAFTLVAVAFVLYVGYYIYKNYGNVFASIGPGAQPAPKAA